MPRLMRLPNRKAVMLVEFNVGDRVVHEYTGRRMGTVTRVRTPRYGGRLRIVVLWDRAPKPTTHDAIVLHHA